MSLSSQGTPPAVGHPGHQHHYSMPGSMLQLAKCCCACDSASRVLLRYQLTRPQMRPCTTRTQKLKRLPWRLSFRACKCSVWPAYKCKAYAACAKQGTWLMGATRCSGPTISSTSCRWSSVAKKIVGRTGQQCAQRWRHKVWVMPAAALHCSPADSLVTCSTETGRLAGCADTRPLMWSTVLHAFILADAAQGPVHPPPLFRRGCAYRLDNKLHCKASLV